MGKAFDMDRLQRRFEVNLAAAKVRFTPATEDKPEPAQYDLGSASARIACRTEALAGLARETGVRQRDTIRRLWIISKCQSCGECADMVAR